MVTIKFLDGELIQNVSWSSLPNKPIKRLKYNFQDKTVIMEDYEAYNHLIEKVYNVLQGTTIIRSIYLIGKIKNHAKIIILNLLDNSVHEEIRAFGEEYKGRPSTGWKNGINDSIPSFQIC